MQYRMGRLVDPADGATLTAGMAGEAFGAAAGAGDAPEASGEDGWDF